MQYYCLFCIFDWKHASLVSKRDYLKANKELFKQMDVLKCFNSNKTVFPKIFYLDKKIICIPYLANNIQTYIQVKILIDRWGICHQACRHTHQPLLLDTHTSIFRRGQSQRRSRVSLALYVRQGVDWLFGGPGLLLRAGLFLGACSCWGTWMGLQGMGLTKLGAG